MANAHVSNSELFWITVGFIAMVAFYAVVIISINTLF